MDLNKPDSFRTQIAAAQNQLFKLWQLQKAVDSRMEDLRQLIRASANFLPDQERRAELLFLELMRTPSNVAEAVKAVLWIYGARNERLTPPQIKQVAEERGFDFASYTNPLASIHTILKRMKDADPPEVDYSETDGTYLSTQWPSGLSDVEKLNSKAFQRLICEDGNKANELALKTLDAIFESLDRNPKRLKE